MAGNPYQAYKQQSVMTMTQGDMLTAVYDGLLKELNFVQMSLTNADFSEVNYRCQKAQQLLLHLQSALDFKFDVANSLNQLYDYFIRAIIQVNIKKSPEGLEDIIGMVAELRDAYVQADRTSRAAESLGQGA